MKKIFSIAFILCLHVSFAQNYSALLIPDSLKKDANAIVRDDITKTVIHSTKSATIYSKSVVTILNEKGMIMPLVCSIMMLSGK